MARDDEDTPVPPHRRSTGNITAWGIVEAWMSADSDHLIVHRMGVRGHEVGARIEPFDGIGATTTAWEPVRPNEDPSSAAVRAISHLPPKK